MKRRDKILQMTLNKSDKNTRVAGSQITKSNEFNYDMEYKENKAEICGERGVRAESKNTMSRSPTLIGSSQNVDTESSTPPQVDKKDANKVPARLFAENKSQQPQSSTEGLSQINTQKAELNDTVDQTDSSQHKAVLQNEGLLARSPKISNIGSSSSSSSSTSSSDSSSDSESTNCSLIENSEQNKTADETNFTESKLRNGVQNEECSQNIRELLPEPKNIVTRLSGSSSLSDSSSDSDSTTGSFIENSDDSVKDPDYLNQRTAVNISESEDSDSDSTRAPDPLPSTSNNISTTSTIDVTEKTKKTRKRVANPREWRQTKAKILRSAGLPYKTKNNVEMRARALKPPCNDKCRLKCAEKIKEDERQAIFQAYWDLNDINRQRDMIHKNMTTINPKYKYSNLEKTRNPNNAFYFTINGNKIRVCKPFFMNTLDINNRIIQTVLKKRTTVGTITEDLRGKHGNHKKLPSDVKEGVRKHIDSIPRIESHYLRQQTTRQFIDGGKTIADLHKDYKEECIENEKPYANYVLYAKIFNTEYNIGFFIPKKDQCALCVAYDNAEGEEKEKLKEKYIKHQKEKELSREEKLKDKESNNVVLVYDLQAVQQLPKGDVSVFFYKSKLNCINFTITDLKTKKTECYFWHEGIGNRGSDEIGSCVFRYIEMIMSSYDDNSQVDIIFYSDNCCGQNKNRFMIAMYLYCVMKFNNLNSITHKFLISGHTQNEGDAVHSVIEKSIKRSLKSGPIYVPSQYAQIIKTAKKTGDPYHVNELTFSDFVSLKKLANDLKFNMTQVKITDVKVIKVLSATPDILYYKTSYGDEDFSETKVYRKLPILPELKRAYLNPIPLGENKKTDLQSLLANNHIPKFYEDFYKSIFEV